MNIPGFTAEASLHNTYQQFQLIGFFEEVHNTIRPQQVGFDTRPRICDDPALGDCRRWCRQQHPPGELRRQCIRDCVDDFCFR
jgi:hypothetical protein